MTNRAENVERIQELTRRYARYSRSNSGLGAVWGGFCMALFGVLTVISYRQDYLFHLATGGRSGFWRFLVSQPSTARSSSLLIGLLIPLLWLFGRAWIQRFVYERHGVVIPSPTTKEAEQLKLLRVLEYFMSIGVLVLVWIGFYFRFSNHVPYRTDWFGLSEASVLLLLLPLVCHRMVSSLDRVMALLIFVAGSGLASGGAAESQVAFILAYSLLGMFQLIQGTRTHIQFRNVCREMDAAKLEEA